MISQFIESQQLVPLTLERFQYTHIFRQDKLQCIIEFHHLKNQTLPVGLLSGEFDKLNYDRCKGNNDRQSRFLYKSAIDDFTTKVKN